MKTMRPPFGDAVKRVLRLVCWQRRESQPHHLSPGIACLMALANGMQTKTPGSAGPRKRNRECGERPVSSGGQLQINYQEMI